MLSHITSITVPISITSEIWSKNTSKFDKHDRPDLKPCGESLITLYFSRYSITLSRIIASNNFQLGYPHFYPEFIRFHTSNPHPAFYPVRAWSQVSPMFKTWNRQNLRLWFAEAFLASDHNTATLTTAKAVFLTPAILYNLLNTAILRPKSKVFNSVFSTRLYK